MSQTQRKCFDTCSDGMRGRSAYVAIADAMLKDNGTMAFVLPFTSMCGARWRKFRNLLRDEYGSIIVISITQPDDSNRSFSADTGMAECLIIASKRNDRKKCTFVSLYERPANSMIAAEIARVIRRLRVRDINSGLSGGSRCMLGEEEVGRAICVSSSDLKGWSPAGVKDLLLAQVCHTLAKGQLVPLIEELVHIPMDLAGAIAAIGTNAGNIAGGRTPRSAGDQFPTRIVPSHDLESKCVSRQEYAFGS